MTDVGTDLLTLAGIAWDPHLRGVLTVLAGVVILMGSVYLILYTNLGSRLGFMLALGGFFGWMTILGFTWWLNPPAIGPRGDLPVWEPVEIVTGDLTDAANGATLEEAQTLPNTCWSAESPSCVLVDGGAEADQIIAANSELFTDIDANPNLSELAALDTEGVIDESVDFGEWELVSSTDAGEAQSEASTVLVDQQELFESPEDFIVLDTFELGGKDGLPEDPDRLDRIWTWVKNTLTPQHPDRYAIVQVQAVVPVEPEPGEAPPPPQPDPDAPVISVIMHRTNAWGGFFGDRRVPPAMVTIGSAILLAVIAYSLHRRDLLADEHRATADASSNGG